MNDPGWLVTLHNTYPEYSRAWIEYAFIRWCHPLGPLAFDSAYKQAKAENHGWVMWLESGCLRHISGEEGFRKFIGKDVLIYSKRRHKMTDENEEKLHPTEKDEIQYPTGSGNVTIISEKFRQEVRIRLVELVVTSKLVSDKEDVINATNQLYEYVMNGKENAK